MLTGMVNDNRKIGIGLTAFGLFFLFLGCLLLFDTALLALGNLLFVLGITLLIGAQKTLIFFSRPQKLRGTVCFVLGIALVLYGWPVIGMAIEVFGILNLFGNFFPIILQLLRNTPFIGPALSNPYVQRGIDKILGAAMPARA